MSRRAVIVFTALSIAASFIACIGDLPGGSDASADGGKDATTDSTLDTGTPDTGWPDTGTPDTGTPDVQAACGLVGGKCCSMGLACVPGAGCCNAICADMQNDGKNCGACAHDCKGGKCAPASDAGDAGGACQPLVFGATTDHDPGTLLMDGQYMYFGAVNSNDGGLYRCDVNGCGDAGIPKVLSQVAFAQDIAQTAQNVYVTGGSKNVIHVWQKTNQDAGTLPVTGPDSVDTDGVRLYFTEQSAPKQSDLNMQGVTYLNNGNSEGITDMVVTGTHVYWTRVFPNVIRVATPGQANSAGDFATLNDQPFGVTASQTHVVWSTWNLGNSDIDVCAVGATCGSVTTLATNQHLGYRPASLLIDGSDVYWTSTEWNGTRGIVSRCPLAGCNQTPTIIARVFSTGQTRPGGIVADATFVYFLMDDDNGIKLYRLVKN